MPDKDIRNIRLVGSLCIGLGAVMFLLTGVLTIIILFSATTADSIHLLDGGIILMTTLIASSTLVACGAQLEHIRPYSRDGIENMRMIWTSLFIVMAVVGIFGLSRAPELSAVAVLVLGLLLM